MCWPCTYMYSNGTINEILFHCTLSTIGHCIKSYRPIPYIFLLNRKLVVAVTDTAHYTAEFQKHCYLFRSIYEINFWLSPNLLSAFYISLFMAWKTCRLLSGTYATTFNDGTTLSSCGMEKWNHWRYLGHIYCDPFCRIRLRHDGRESSFRGSRLISSPWLGCGSFQGSKGVLRGEESAEQNECGRK